MAAKAVLPFGAEKTDDTDPAEPAKRAVDTMFDFA